MRFYGEQVANVGKNGELMMILFLANVQIKVINGPTISTAQIKAIDRECLKIIVAPLCTPSGELPTAILRLTDIAEVEARVEVNISEQ